MADPGYQDLVQGVFREVSGLNAPGIDGWLSFLSIAVVTLKVKIC